MSRAFIKEDVDIPERSGRRRSAGGLPPGAINYMTKHGAEQLRARLATLHQAGRKDIEEITNLELILNSVTVIEPQTQSDVVVFGTIVVLQLPDQSRESYRIVGVDEVQLEPVNVSWVSPIARLLLGARVGQKLKFPDQEQITRIVLAIG